MPQAVKVKVQLNACETEKETKELSPKVGLCFCELWKILLDDFHLSVSLGLVPQHSAFLLFSSISAELHRSTMGWFDD